MKKKSLAVLFAVAAVSLFAAGGASGASLILPRAGQVGIGLLGNFGTLLESGQLGDEFGSGFGMGVRLRYRMRYERAIGLSFDQHYLDSRVPGYPEGAFSGYKDVGDSLLTRDQLVMTTTGFDFYQMFDTRQRNVKWVSVSAGLVQVSAKLSDGETQYPNGSDGTFLGAGLGVERFVYRSWGLDFEARYQAIFYGSTVNHNLQASAGLIFYAAY
jgi:hypothetical protein